MKWTINIARKAEKQIQKLPKFVKAALFLLIKDLALNGPATGGTWKNYGKLKGLGSGDLRHCHLVKGRPTYVCCWEIVDKQVRIIEVYYVGSHEKAPY